MEARVSERQHRMLIALERGPRTLAGLRSALPPDDPQAAALPSMGEPDELGDELMELVNRGWIDDVEGRYALSDTGGAWLSDAPTLPAPTRVIQPHPRRPRD